MKTLKLSIALTLACILIASCSKNETEPIVEYSKTSPLIEKLTEVNSAYAEQAGPQTKGLWNFFKKVWTVVSADVAAAFEVVSADTEEFVKVATSNNPLQWTLYGLKTVPTVAGASKKAYKKGCGLEEPLPTYKSALLCMDYVANAIDAGNSLTNRNSAGILGGGDLEYDEESVDMAVPLEYAWTLDLANGHNVGLDFFLEDEGEESIDEDTISELSETYGLDLKTYEKMNSVLTGIGYKMDYSVFFDSKNLAENVLILYSQLYEQVNSFEDITTITEQYIDIVYKSDELTEEEKAALISALSVSVYSSRYWKDVISATE